MQEEREAFVIRVVLEEGQPRARIATFAVRKRAWDDWWEEVSQRIAPWSVTAVALDAPRLPSPRLKTEEGEGSCAFGSEGRQVGESAIDASCLPDDTWDNGSLNDPPEPPIDHTAVWTGSAMVIWGGNWQMNRTNRGERYDPATDSWAPTSTTGAPMGRMSHTAVWTGGEMIVWGGDRGVTYTDTGGRYNPVMDSWMPTSRTGAQCLSS